MTTETVNLLIAVAPSVLTGCGGAWAVYKYFEERKAAAAKEATTRRVESQKPFLEAQLKLYLETADVVGVLVSTPITDAWREVEKRFWALFWSRLAMVEDKNVQKEMERFAGRLLRHIATGASEDTQKKLEQQAVQLAHVIRASIESAWGSPVTPVTTTREEMSKETLLKLADTTV
jgi:hypothetical protein